MKKRYYLLVGLVLLLAIALILPLLIPSPPVEGAMTVQDLADDDSRFAEMDGLTVHYKVDGRGEPAFLLLHGFGASTFSWRHLITPLAEKGTVASYDRPAFGLTSRPERGEWTGDSPYGPEAQVDLAVGLLDELGIDRAILVGNSAGGTVAVQTALAHPERVKALILIDPAIYAGGGAPSWVKPLLATPQMRRLGPYLLRSAFGRSRELVAAAWHDPSRLTDEVVAGYARYLAIPDWDKALWELVLASKDPELESRLAALSIPTLVITGDDDRIVPTEQSVRLASELPNASLAVIPQCGHVPHEECPEATLQAINEFLSTLP